MANAKRKKGSSSSSWLSKLAIALVIGAVCWFVYQYNQDVWKYFFPDEDPTVKDTTQTDPQPAPDEDDNSRDARQGNIRLTNYNPTATGSNQIVTKTYFSLSYADAYEDAEWVAYELTKERVAGGVERAGSFRPDPAVLKGTATPDDYKATGYDRGHLAPAADMAFNTSAMSESFFMSNMTPQEPGFNRGIWKELEDQVRDYAKACSHVYVVTGPILPKNIKEQIGKKNKVSVPKSFYKIVVDLTAPEYKGIAFILPNEDSDQKLEKYVVTIDQVEQLTGLNFFPTLTKAQEKLLETTSDISKWGVDPVRAQARIMQVQMRRKAGMRLAAEN